MKSVIALVSTVLLLAFAATAAANPPAAAPVTCSGNSTSLSFQGLPLVKGIGITVNAYPIVPGGFYWPITLDNSKGAPDETLPFPYWPGPGTYVVTVQIRPHQKVETLGSCLVTI
jgi:hypothetical protein